MLLRLWVLVLITLVRAQSPEDAMSKQSCAECVQDGYVWCSDGTDANSGCCVPAGDCANLPFDDEETQRPPFPLPSFPEDSQRPSFPHPPLPPAGSSELPPFPHPPLPEDAQRSRRHHDRDEDEQPEDGDRVNATHGDHPHHRRHHDEDRPHHDESRPASEPNSTNSHDGRHHHDRHPHPHPEQPSTGHEDGGREGRREWHHSRDQAPPADATMTPPLPPTDAPPLPANGVIVVPPPTSGVPLPPPPTNGVPVPPSSNDNSDNEEPRHHEWLRREHGGDRREGREGGHNDHERRHDDEDEREDRRDPDEQQHDHRSEGPERREGRRGGAPVPPLPANGVPHSDERDSRQRRHGDREGDDRRGNNKDDESRQDQQHGEPRRSHGHHGHGPRRPVGGAPRCPKRSTLTVAIRSVAQCPAPTGSASALPSTAPPTQPAESTTASAMVPSVPVQSPTFLPPPVIVDSGPDAAMIRLPPRGLPDPDKSVPFPGVEEDTTDRRRGPPQNDDNDDSNGGGGGRHRGGGRRHHRGGQPDHTPDGSTGVDDSNNNDDDGSFTLPRGGDRPHPPHDDDGGGVNDDESGNYNDYGDEYDRSPRDMHGDGFFVWVHTTPGIVTVCAVSFLFAIVLVAVVQCIRRRSSQREVQAAPCHCQGPPLVGGTDASVSEQQPSEAVVVIHECPEGSIQAVPSPKPSLAERVKGFFTRSRPQAYSRMLNDDAAQQ